MNYSVSSSSPTDELVTIGQILSEVGDYASTFLDREHMSMSRKCLTRLNKVVGELVSRQCILSAENLHDIPEAYPIITDLTVLTIAELHNLYRCWPIRHKEHEAKGREAFSFYYEGRIVRELKRRKASNKAEQLKIDYCVATYHNELDNLSFVLSRPVRTEGEKILPDNGRRYTPDELSALICLYKNYRDIVEREILVEYADYALDLLEHEKDAVSCLGLLSEVAELGRRKIIRIPGWVSKKLEDTIDLALTTKTGNDAELSLAMLTLQMQNGDSSLGRKARRIINRCYRSAFDDSADLGKRIEYLHTAVTCCDYVTRFSIRKAAALWHTLSAQAQSSAQAPTPKQTFQLLDIAKACEAHAPISPEPKERQAQRLEAYPHSDSPEPIAFYMILQKI